MFTSRGLGLGRVILVLVLISSGLGLGLENLVLFTSLNFTKDVAAGGAYVVFCRGQN